MAVFALIQMFTWDGRIYWLRQTQWSAVGPFVNRDHFAGYMEMLIPFPVGLLAARAIRPEQRLLYAFAAVMMTVALIASLSRGGLISLAAGLAFIPLAARRLHRKGTRAGSRAPIRASMARAGVAAAVFAALGLTLFWIGPVPIINRASATIDQLKEDSNSGQYFSRQWIWKDALSMWKAHPLTGIGLGAFQTVYPVYGHSDDSMIVPAAHNDYLQVLADGGIIGAALLLCFIGLVSRAIYGAVRGPDRFVTGMALGGGAAILAMLVHSLFDFNLQIPSNALLFLVITAVVGPTQSRKAAEIRKARLQVG
jgi:O-antigen ligase